MRIITIPEQNKTPDGDYSVLALLVYVVDSMIIVNYFGKAKTNRFPANQVTTITLSLDEFKNYLTLTDQPVTVKQCVKNAYDAYIGYTVKLHDIDEQFADTEDQYVFLGHSVLTYDVYTRRRDFETYVAGYDYYLGTATLFRSRFAETKNTFDSLFLWECINYVRGMAYFTCPSASLDLMSDENVLVVKKTHQCVIHCPSETVIEEATDDQYRFYTQCQNYFPELTLECDDTVQANSKLTVKVTARRKTIDSQTLSTMASDEFINYPVKLYFECSAGYLPINRIDLVNGQGQFDLYTDHVPVGTKIDIKLNSKNISRLTSKTVEVV